ncbi:hypothetical protein pdam_00012591 [Pocillopora damicornis]|uniref:Uncharacterized protein n=1 Tax=Pocillopora damicornis TaxID=46731 RepID=A0A3M6U0V6_POCDA|nr:hypothetical protein pdam_00012591 [Pocillopora damicornis]
MHSLISIKDDFFERRSQKRPVYTLKLDQEGKIVRDKNGILVVLVKSYVQGELKTTKQLLYREAIDGVLSSLHYIKGVLGEDTCLLGGFGVTSERVWPCTCRMPDETRPGCAPPIKASGRSGKGSDKKRAD